MLVNIEPRVDSIPQLGLVTYRDAESGETVVLDTSNKQVRAAWQSMLQARHEAFSEIASRCRADQIRISTDDAASPLLRLMQERAARRRR